MPYVTLGAAHHTHYYTFKTHIDNVSILMYQFCALLGYNPAKSDLVTVLRPFVTLLRDCATDTQ